MVSVRLCSRLALFRKAGCESYCFRIIVVEFVSGSVKDEIGGWSSGRSNARGRWDTLNVLVDLVKLLLSQVFLELGHLARVEKLNVVLRKPACGGGSAIH